MKIYIKNFITVRYGHDHGHDHDNGLGTVTVTLFTKCHGTVRKIHVHAPRTKLSLYIVIVI